MSTITAPPHSELDARIDRRAALLLSSVLLLAGVLVGVSPLLGVVQTADGSATAAAAGAGFMAVLPGLLAVLLAARRPVLGLAATAGAGLIGLVRVLADLAVVTDADRITRPELFAETTERARPFSPAVGGWVLLVADVVWLAVGVVAAVRLAPSVAGTLAPPTDGFFGPPAAAEAAQAAVAQAEPPDGTGVGAAMSHSPPGRRLLNLPMIGVGFLGSVLLMIGALGTPFQGGYLTLRVLPFGSSLTGLVAAAVLGFLCAVIVVVAAALPPAIGAALLAGTALAAAVPSLTAIAAVLTGAPTGLSPVVWCGVAGAVVLAAAALLTRRGRRDTATDDSDGAPPARWMTWGTGALALLSAAALLAASRSPLLYLDGAAPDEISGGALLPAALPHLVAAVPLGVAGVLALLPPLAGSARVALTVVWAGSVYAFGQGLWVRSLVLSTAGATTGTTQHSWTTGPGQWFSIIGAVGAIASALLAAVTLRRASQASLDVVDDDSLSASRAARRWPAVGLTVLVLVALAVPAYRDLTGPGPSLLHGYDLDTWGFWSLVTAALIGIWAGALTARAAFAVVWPAAAAVVVVQPLFVPESVRAVPGFGYGAGLWLVLLAGAVLLGAAGWFGALARRVRVEAGISLAGGGPARSAPTAPAGKDGRRSAQQSQSGERPAAQPKGR